MCECDSEFRHWCEWDSVSACTLYEWKKNWVDIHKHHGAFRAHSITPIAYAFSSWFFHWFTHTHLSLPLSLFLISFSLSVCEANEHPCYKVVIVFVIVSVSVLRLLAVRKMLHVSLFSALIDTSSFTLLFLNIAEEK